MTTLVDQGPVPAATARELQRLAISQDLGRDVVVATHVNGNLQFAVPDPVAVAFDPDVALATYLALKELDTIGELAVAQATGISVASYAQLENTSATVLPLAGTLTTIPVTLDASGGSDITVDVDGQTVILATEGVYSISAQVQTTTGHTVTLIMAQVVWADFPMAGKYGEDFNNFKVPRTDGGVVRYADLYRVAAGASFVFKIGANAVSDSALSWLGVDIIRVV